MKKYVYLGQSHCFKKGDEILINLSLFITLAWFRDNLFREFLVKFPVDMFLRIVLIILTNIA